MADPLFGQRPPYVAVDFQALATKDNHFNEIWQNSSGHLNFQDPETVKALTKAILKVDFGLQLELPDGRLCPPVPNRWNYVTWIQGLLDSTSPDFSITYNPERKVVGLDIGTGASAIYAMLCLKARPNWTMCATDIDKKSFDSAARNLALNNLLTRAKMLQTAEMNSLIPLKYLGVQKLDFTICNPPFFEDEKEMQASLRGEGKSAKPNAICTGAEVEMVYPGGDLGFVTRIVEESLILREKVTWYSSMLGKMTSAKQIVGLLKKNGVSNWAVGVIDTGGSTKRWVVAWSFGDLRPRNSIARLDTIANEYLPFPTSYNIDLPPGQDPQSTKDTIHNQLSSLDLHWSWNPEDSTGIGVATQNVWKRAYRREHDRRKKEGIEEMADADIEAKKKKAALAFRITIIELAREVEIEWLKGNDQVLWESFCGLIHRNFKKS